MDLNIFKWILFKKKKKKEKLWYDEDNQVHVLLFTTSYIQYLTVKHKKM